MSSNYLKRTIEIKQKLDNVSQTMCTAKWLHAGINLTNGTTNSCCLAEPHHISEDEILDNPSALHNTSEKKKERSFLLDGRRHKSCSTCWKIEDQGSEFSDRHFKSSESWAFESFDDVLKVGAKGNINPKYLELNFSNGCNFKCSYCSPHLSSTWQAEIEKHGPYPTNPQTNSIDYLIDKELMPIPNRFENPYIDAFWKWIPEAYHDLKILRLTGGEPLMDKNTYRLFDYIIANPKLDLELCLTSNFCPDKVLWDKFIGYLPKVQACVKKITIFVSLDSYGFDAEYIRHGLDFKTFDNNVNYILKETNVDISIICTFNIFSIPNFKALLDYVLNLRSIWSNDKNRIGFDVPILFNPSFMSAQLATEKLKKKFANDVDYMSSKIGVPINGEFVTGFSDFEIKKVEKCLEHVNESISEFEYNSRKDNFKKFFNEHDKRRQTDLLSVFPSLIELYQVEKTEEVVQVETKSIKDQSNFCIMPFVGFNMQTDGKVKLCCKNHVKTGDSRTESFVKIWNSDQYKKHRMQFINNERPATCRECWDIEDGGTDTVSYRSMMNHKFASVADEALKYTNRFTGEMEFRPKYVEFVLSSLCNLACKMCHPSISTSLAGIWDNVVPIINVPNHKLEKSYKTKEELLEDAKLMAPHLEFVSFSGGEPLMEENFKNLFDILLPYKHNIDFVMITNMSKLKHGRFDLLTDLLGFKKVTLVISIEGSPKVHEYIRINSNMDAIVENIKLIREKIPNINIVVNSTSQALNVLDWPKAMDFLLTEIKPNWLTNGMVYNNYLASSLLPIELKKEAEERIKTYLSNLKPFSEPYGLYEHVEKLATTVINNMYRPDDIAIRSWNEFYDFNTKLDSVVNNNILDVVPELKPYWNRK